MAPETLLGIWIGVLLVVIAGGVYGILFLRKWLVSPDDDQQEENDRLCTTAEIERLREQGLIDQAQYDSLKREVFQASRRRAQRLARRKRRAKKSGLFG